MSREETPIKITCDICGKVEDTHAKNPKGWYRSAIGFWDHKDEFQYLGSGSWDVCWVCMGRNEYLARDADSRRTSVFKLMWSKITGRFA